MTDVENRSHSEGQREPTNLDRRYRDIGISAVVAALRYTTADAAEARMVVAGDIDPRFIEAAV